MRVLGLLGIHDPDKQKTKALPSRALIKRHKAHVVKATADLSVKKDPGDFFPYLSVCCEHF